MHDEGEPETAPAQHRHWLSRLLNSIVAPLLFQPREERTEYVRILALLSAGADPEILREVASRMKWNLTLAASAEQVLHAAKSEVFAVILCDRDVPANWKELLHELIRSAPRSAVIFISDSNDRGFWQEVTRQGGYDVLRKPLCSEIAGPVVARAVTYWRIR